MEKYKQLCVWPGTIVGLDKKGEFESFMFDEFKVRVKYECEVLTKPYFDEGGKVIPETGGRNDLFFYLHNNDISKFAIQRLSMGIRWWEDCVSYNDCRGIYTE